MVQGLGLRPSPQLLVGLNPLQKTSEHAQIPKRSRTSYDYVSGWLVGNKEWIPVAALYHYLDSLT